MSFDYTLLSESLFMVQIFLYLELNISGHCSVLPEDLYFTHCQRNLDIIPQRLSFLCFSTVNLLKNLSSFFSVNNFHCIFHSRVNDYRIKLECRILRLTFIMLPYSKFPIAFCFMEQKIVTNDKRASGE